MRCGFLNLACLPSLHDQFVNVLPTARVTIPFIALSALLALTELSAIPSLGGSKIIVLSADPMTEGKVDLELSFSLLRAQARFNEYEHKKDLQSSSGYPYAQTSESQNGLSFRITGGIAPSLEAGLSYGQSSGQRFNEQEYSQFQDVIGGFKYRIKDTGTLRFAAEAGALMETKNWSVEYQLGGIATWDAAEKVTIDAEGWLLTTAPRDQGAGNPAMVRGGGFNTGISYKGRRLTPVLEVGFSRSYYWTERNYNLGRELSKSSPLPADNVDIDLVKAGVVPASVTMTVPGIGAAQVPVTPPQERVRVWRSKITVIVGLATDFNNTASMSVGFGRDVYGQNVLVGSSGQVFFTVHL